MSYYKSWGLDNYWSDVPGWKNTLWTVLFYLNGNHLLWYICLLTGALLCVGALRYMRRPASEEKVRVMMAAFSVVVAGWVIGVVFVFSRYIYPEGGLFVERYFTVVQPQILLVTALGLDYILDLADWLATSAKLKSALPARVSAWVIRVAVILILASAFVTCYRDSYRAIRKPLEPYREAADYLIEEQGIWDDKSLFLGSNEFCALDGFVHYYFEKRGYEPPAHVVDSMVHSEQETRFYQNYAQLSKEQLLSYDRVYCLRIHMDVDDAMKQILDDYYVQVQTKEENGVEIWERKDRIS